jgi:hypothetical protein
VEKLTSVKLESELIPASAGMTRKLRSLNPASETGHSASGRVKTRNGLRRRTRGRIGRRR